MVSPDEENDLFDLGYYEWGCEGDGHYFETDLEPGMYEIRKVSE